MNLLYPRRKKSRPNVRMLHDGQLPGLVVAGSLPVDERITLESREALQATQVKGRIWLCLSVFVISFFALGARLADVTLMGTAEERLARFAPAVADTVERPLILDRNERRLAMNQEVTGAAIRTRDVWNAEETAEKLVTVFPDKQIDDLKSRIESKAYVPLASELSELQRQDLLALGLPGVELVPSLKRVYPQGALAAHAVGYTVPGRGGITGLENVLDASGANKALIASLDVRAQQILEEELLQTLQEFSAIAAWGVIMDVTTGEIIALANLPEFNPNDPSMAEPGNWRNRAMYDLYELGSAFKILTAAAALEDGITDTVRQYDVRAPLQVRNRVISDYKPKGGFMSLTEILQYSSNIGIAQIALEHGQERQKHYLQQLGLTRQLGTELPEKRSPMLPLDWGEVETATVSYGHGIAVTPLQLTAAIGAVVNGGIYVPPTFLKAGSGEAAPGRRVFSEETSATMRLILRRVITDGTGRSAEAPGYYIIGKTATADKPSPFGGYKKDERLSSFVGAFPGYAPRYVMLISFDEPQPTAETYGYATAGIVAAPAFQRIVARLAPVIGIQPVNDDLAFAQFMSAFRETEEVQLAMISEDLFTPDVVTEPDEVAKLLAELGP